MPDDDIAARWAPIAAAASGIAESVVAAYAPLVAAINEQAADEAALISSYAGLASIRGGLQ